MVRERCDLETACREKYGKAYIAAVATAQSLKDLYKYLPRRVRPRLDNLKSGNVLASSKAAYDKSARSDLKRRKRIAKTILDVLSVKIDGNKAVIMVSTTSGGISNGVSNQPPEGYRP